MRFILRRILDFISPRVCPVCGKRSAVTEEMICAVCNWHLPRTYYHKNAYENNLAKIFWGRFPIEKATSLFFYQAHNDPSRMIYDLKYHGKGHLAYWLGKESAIEAKESHFFEDIDLIIPVPITLGRKWRRGYNQSELIAQGISEITGIPVNTKALKRTIFTQSQTKLSTFERSMNVEKAFLLTNGEGLRGKHILLIDDVITTGATITACAKVLMTAGVTKFSVMSVGFTKP